MGEFEDQLGAILGNQEAMGQIMALAQSLSGGGTQQSNGPAEETEQGEQASPPNSCQSNQPAAPAADPLSALMSGLDPRLIQLGMRAIREFQREDDRKTALLRDLRPFVREERYEKLDRAIQIARLSRVIRVLFDAVREEGEGRV